MCPLRHFGWRAGVAIAVVKGPNDVWFLGWSKSTGRRSCQCRAATSMVRRGAVTVKEHWPRASGMTGGTAAYLCTDDGVLVRA